MWCEGVSRLLRLPSKAALFLMPAELKTGRYNF